MLLYLLVYGSYLAVVAEADARDPGQTSAPLVGFAAFSDSPCGAELGDRVDASTWMTWYKSAFQAEAEVCGGL